MGGEYQLSKKAPYQPSSQQKAVEVSWLLKGELALP